VLWVRVKSLRPMFWDITNSVSSGTTVQLMIKVGYFMLYNAMAHEKKTLNGCPTNRIRRTVRNSTTVASQITRLVSVRKSFVEDTIDATYVNNPQPFHQHSTARVPPCVQKYFRRAPVLLRSWRSALGDCPVQYGTLNSEGCDWSELRSVLLFCTQASADITERLGRCRPCSNMRPVLLSVRQVTSTRY